MAVHHPALLEIALVVLFRLPEGLCWTYLGRNRVTVSSRRAEFSYLSPGLCLLLAGVGEDDAAVLGSQVRSLTVHLCGIVHREERVEKGLVGEARWIKCDLNDFYMTGSVRTDFFISWMFEIPTLISYNCVDDSCDFVEFCFYTPKASCSEGRLFNCHSWLLLYCSPHQHLSN